MTITKYYKHRLPSRIIRLIKWLLAMSYFHDQDRVNDTNGSTHYMIFQLSFSKVMIVINKDNDGEIIFRLEVERE